MGRDRLYFKRQQLSYFIFVMKGEVICFLFPYYVLIVFFLSCFSALSVFLFILISLYKITI